MRTERPGRAPGRRLGEGTRYTSVGEVRELQENRENRVRGADVRLFQDGGILFSKLFMTTSLHETSDIYLACFLFSQGATYDHCERIGPRRNNFFFVADENLHHLLRLYWRRVPMTLVPAQVFDALRQLKSLSRLQPEPAPGNEFDQSSDTDDFSQASEFNDEQLSLMPQ